MSPPTNQHPVFYRPNDLPVAQPTVSKHGTKISIPILHNTALVMTQLVGKLWNPHS